MPIVGVRHVVRNTRSDTQRSNHALIVARVVDDAISTRADVTGSHAFEYHLDASDDRILLLTEGALLAAKAFDGTHLVCRIGWRCAIRAAGC
jgi:hypothetical protein